MLYALKLLFSEPLFKDSFVKELLKSSTDSCFLIESSNIKDKARNKFDFPELLCPINTLTPSWKSISILSKFLKFLILILEMYIFSPVL